MSAVSGLGRWADCVARSGRLATISEWHHSRRGAMIDFEFSLQTWSGIAESLHAAGVANALPAADDGCEGREGGRRR